MKTLVILVLTLGIVGVIANPVSKQTIQSENKNSPQAESSDSQTKHGDVINTPNKGDQEQKKDTPIESPEWPNIIDTSKSEADGTVEISIEENIINHGPDDKFEQDQEKYFKTETPDIDSAKNDDGSVEIIIEESIVSTTDDNPQSGDFSAGPLQLPEFNEDVPHLPGANEDIPLLPEFIGGDPSMPDFVEDPQEAGGFARGPQLPGQFSDGSQLKDEFANGPRLPELFKENPQLPLFMGSIPQLTGFIEGGPQIPGFNIDSPQLPQDMEDDFHIDPDYFRDDMQKIEHEIMETAAGFVPTPLVFRRKHKPRRRFATRRHFRRNPYRRHQFFHPYRYYAFYRPSSLRYY